MTLDGGRADGEWLRFIRAFYDLEVEAIVTAPDEQDHFTFLVDGFLMFDYDILWAQSVYNDPKTQLSLAASAVVELQQEILDRFTATSAGTGSLKPVVLVRFDTLYNSSISDQEIYSERLPVSGDAGKLKVVNGTVIRTGSVRVLERNHIWRCATCQGLIEVEGQLEMRYKLFPPRKCPTTNCRGSKFREIERKGQEKCTDYQEIRIQEKVEQLQMGSLPRSMTVILEYDLVDRCTAGDDVTVCGIVSLLWDAPLPGLRCSLEIALHANNIKVTNKRESAVEVTELAVSRHHRHWRQYRDAPFAGRNLLLASFCPDVFQLYIVKLAALLALLGGVTHVDGRGTKVRGESHLLLVGDPGTGKSQILKYCSKLVSRSVITTGIGCTKAGLTVAAVKDGGEWGLEAGAMVLADGGVCCVDELSSIRESDRVSIHEAMEQQTISVAKAGLVCKLNTRTTVLAATNPRGSYDITQPISVNVPIGTPLLSRFDLILVLFDDHTPSWDSRVADFILGNPSEVLRNYPTEALWSFEDMQSYVNHVRSLTPKLSPGAKEVLGRYYRRQREQVTRNVSRTTIRMLESLVRLSQAHAKLMMRQRVAVDDAIVTISIVESTMLTSSLLGSVSVLHSVFPDDPDEEFRKQRSMVLELLELPTDFGDIPDPSIQPLIIHRRDIQAPSDERADHPSAQRADDPTKHPPRNKQPKRRRPPTEKKAENPPPPAPSETIKSEASSAVAAPSFAELVRRHKARKRGPPKPASPVETIEDILAEDLSDILGPRANTPVTTMFNKFNKTIDLTSAPAQRETDGPPSFTPIIDTQCRGLASSGKENDRPLPRFTPSPVTMPTQVAATGHVIDDVTEEELRAKTTKPPDQTSVFHAESAKKLQRFAFKSRNNS